MNTAHTVPAARPPSPRPGLTVRVICAWCDRPLDGGTRRPCARQHFGITLPGIVRRVRPRQN